MIAPSRRDEIIAAPGIGRSSVVASQPRAAWLERLAFGLLIVVTLTFSFDAPWWTSGIGDASWSTVRIEVVACLALWLLSCVVSTRFPYLPGRTLVVAGIVFLTALLASALLAPSYRPEALKSWARMLSGVLLGLATCDLARTQARRSAVGRALALGGLAVALLGLAEALGVQPVVVWLEAFRYGPTPVRDLPRLSSTLPNPNITAMVFELTLPFLLAWMFAVKKRWVRATLVCGAVVEVSALLLTFSRAGLVAFLIALIILVVGSGAGRTRGIRAAGVLAIAGTALTLLALPGSLSPLIYERLAEELELTTFHTSYDVPATLSAHAGTLEVVPIRLTNAGQTTWSASGARRFGVGYHVRTVDGSPVTYDNPASPLPADVAPGGTIVVDTQLRVANPGTYRVEWDGVQQGVTWFSWRGTPPGTTIVTVEPSANGADQPTVATGSPTIFLPPFSRVFAWSTAWRMVNDRLLFGVGPDNYRWRFRDYSGLNLSNIGVHAHDIYLEWLADGGVIGFLASLWLSVQLLGEAAARLRRRSTSAAQRGLALAIVAALAAWFAHGVLDDFYRYTPTLVAFWIIAGLGISQSRVTEYT